MDISPIIKSLEEKSKNAYPVEGEDYKGPDGLWYCGKCRTAKQISIEILGTVYHPMTLCRCGEEKARQEEEARKKREFCERVARNRSRAFRAASYRNCAFDTSVDGDEKYFAFLKDYAARFPEYVKEGKGLYICGPTGVGKTYGAAALANAILDMGFTVYMVSLPQLVGEIGRSGNARQEALEGLAGYDLLVLDDFGAERNSEYVTEAVYEIIDGRYTAKLPVVITGNVEVKNMQNSPDMQKSRIYSRIMEMCIPFRLDGNDRRWEAAGRAARERRGK